MSKIEIYSKAWCPYCNKAKALLKSTEPEYREINITHDEEREQQMLERSRRQTVPQIFIDGISIRGYDDVAHFNATGELVHQALIGIVRRNISGTNETDLKWS